MDASQSSSTRGMIVIPARMASTRLPNKLLLSETGEPLLAYVVRNALEAARRSNGPHRGPSSVRHDADFRGDGETWSG